MPTVRFPDAVPTDAQRDLLGRLFEQEKADSGVPFAQWCTQLALQGLWRRGPVSGIIDTMLVAQRTRRAQQREQWSEQREINQRQRAEYVSGPLVNAPADVDVPVTQAPLPIGATLDGIHIVNNVAYRVGVLPRRRWERDAPVNDPARRRYVWRLIVAGNGHARWVRVGALSHNARRLGIEMATLATLDQAREFGSAFGICLNCGRTLVVEQSIERALGPVCFRRIQGQQAFREEQLRQEAQRLAARIDELAPEQRDSLVDAINVIGNVTPGVDRVVISDAAYGPGVAMSTGGVVTLVGDENGYRVVTNEGGAQ